MEGFAMGIIGFLAVPLGYVMRAIYGAVQNYGVAIILFTALVKVCLLPLTIHQQKSTAKMSVFSPMIQDIQKKYAKDQERAQEEMMKLQEEYGFSPTAGCAHGPDPADHVRRDRTGVPAAAVRADDRQ